MLNNLSSVLTLLIKVARLCVFIDDDMDISKAICPECSQPLKVARMSCPACKVAMEGEFELSALGKLSLDDQAFVIAFVRHHGSLKKMESLFGISYPTVKNRLNAIGAT